DQARVAYFYLREDGTAAPAWASFDTIDLAETADALRELAARTPDAAATTEGEHCDYCPAFMSCPAKVALARAVGDGTALAGVQQRVGEMPAGELGAVYVKLERVLDVVERIKETARRRAAMVDVPLGDGRVLGTVQWPYTVVNAKVALDVVTERHGGEVADA